MNQAVNILESSEPSIQGVGLLSGFPCSQISLYLVTKLEISGISAISV